MLTGRGAECQLGALIGILVPFRLTEAQARTAARNISTPVTVTKRGMLAWAQKGLQEKGPARAVKARLPPRTTC